MTPLAQRYSEPYTPTGGLAAEGVLNQLGRPDIEPLEVLVREAVQNCWDAKRRELRSIRVEIGRRTWQADEVDELRRRLLVDPPPGLPLGAELSGDVEALFFADFGTDGLGGPTRADRPGAKRDFVDFVRNIGQPPDKDLGGGSFGYGKAAFYIASRARTILVDTLCVDDEGHLERRLIGCGLGENYDEAGRPYTGRHWWGEIVDGVPEPLTGPRAEEAASLLRLPARRTVEDLGTTVVVVAPGVAPETEDGADATMEFVGEALVWNFWPRMIDTRGAVKRTMDFRLTDDEVPVAVPDPRTHPRLRGFVEAMDRMREEPGDSDDFTMDRQVESFRPVQLLGRLVIQKGPTAPVEPVGRAVPQGARLTADSVHHVALMRNAELVVRYLPGPAPLNGRIGYSGVFRCAVDVDDAFRRSEPPTHDDWVYRAVPKGRERSFVKIALDRVSRACREAAGYDDSSMNVGNVATGVSLGEFADTLATLMPGSIGPGARRAGPTVPTRRRKRRTAPGRTEAQAAAEGVWTEGAPASDTQDPGRDAGPGHAQEPGDRRLPAPQVKTSGDPVPAIATDGAPVVRYPFELRDNGGPVHLRAAVEVMSNDGAQVEADPPAGSAAPAVRGWIDPSGSMRSGSEIVVQTGAPSGRWFVEVTLHEEAMMRVDVQPERA
jgi:hypothetical protein